MIPLNETEVQEVNNRKTPIAVFKGQLLVNLESLYKQKQREGYVSEIDGKTYSLGTSREQALVAQTSALERGLIGVTKIIDRDINLEPVTFSTNAKFDTHLGETFTKYGELQGWYRNTKNSISKATTKGELDEIDIYA